MAPIILFVSLVSLYMGTYMMNKRIAAPIITSDETSCHGCSNHTCSHYKGGEE